MDLERLDDALERLDNMAPWHFDAADPDCLTFADAARAYRDLLANGERVDPDYEEAHRIIDNWVVDNQPVLHYIPTGVVVDAVRAAIGDRLLIPPTEGEA